MTMIDPSRIYPDQDRREQAAKILDRSYPKVADKIRAGMRSSTWPEDLIDPGTLLDLLETYEEREQATCRAIRELLELIDMSEMECRSLPPHEYDAIKDGAVSWARKALLSP